jgi:hypothetical protein
MTPLPCFAWPGPFCLSIHLCDFYLSLAFLLCSALLCMPFSLAATCTFIPRMITFLPNCKTRNYLYCQSVALQLLRLPQK